MSIQKLIKTVERLRAPDGCPWDREQTHETLFPYLIEETYEAIESFRQDPKEFKGELGDILLQIVLHSQIANERGDFSFEDVAAYVNEKMIRRHPHVFSDTQVSSSKEVLTNWEDIKQKEKENDKANKKDKSILEGVPSSLPALLKAFRIGEKVSAIGFDWNQPSEVIAKVKEEVSELEAAISLGDTENMEEEFGDILFSLTHLARHLNINAEFALNLTNNKFIKRFKWMEQYCKENNLVFSELEINELDEIWDKAKQALKKNCL